MQQRIIGIILVVIFSFGAFIVITKILSTAKETVTEVSEGARQLTYEVSKALLEEMRKANPKLSDLTCMDIANHYVGSKFGSKLGFIKGDFQVLNVDKVTQKSRSDREVVCDVSVWTTDGQKNGEFIARTDGESVFYTGKLSRK